MTRLREVQMQPLRPGDEKARRWNIVAVAIASLTGIGAALLPLGTSSSVDSAGVTTSSGVSLLSNEGVGVLMIVAVPALLVAVPLLLRGETATRRARVAVVVLLGIGVVLAALSIGVFFVPTLLAMIMALATQSPSRSAPASMPPPPGS